MEKEKKKNILSLWNFFYGGVFISCQKVGNGKYIWEEGLLYQPMEKKYIIYEKE